MERWEFKSVRLTADASRAWDSACTRKGVSMTALMEALGERLTDGQDWVPDEAVDRARQIDRQRRSRRSW